EVLGLEELERVPGRSAPARLEAAALERFIEHLAHAAVVVDDQRPALHARSPAVAQPGARAPGPLRSKRSSPGELALGPAPDPGSTPHGRKIEKQLPRPGEVSSSIHPSWSRTMP